MAAYISFQPTDFFNTKLYTGNASTNIISSIGFNPDMTWIKERDGLNNHALFDTVRGDDKHIEPNLTNAEATESGALAFGTDKFTLGNWTTINGSGKLFASWNWKAGTTSGLSGGTITPTAYSINTTSGFGIYKYTGNTTSGATIAHGLGVAPKVVITKRIVNSSSAEWNSIWNVPGLAATDFLRFTQVNKVTASWGYNDTFPDATNFTLGNNAQTNSSEGMIAYAFAPIKGYSKFSSYTGNGNADGTFVYTGFRPAFVMVHRFDSGSEDWNMWNNKALGYNIDNNKQYANLTTVESTADEIDLLSNGFKWRTTNGGLNASGGTYAYMAFAEFPLVSSNSKAGTAR